MFFKTFDEANSVASWKPTLDPQLLQECVPSIIDNSSAMSIKDCNSRGVLKMSCEKFVFRIVPVSYFPTMDEVLVSPAMIA